MARLSRSEPQNEKFSLQETDNNENRDSLTDSFESADLQLGDDSIEEEDSLMRLSEQARRRQSKPHNSAFGYAQTGDFQDEMAVEDDDSDNGSDHDYGDAEIIERENDGENDYDMEGDDEHFMANDFLRNLLRTRLRGRGGEGSDSSPLDFFRAMEAMSGPARGHTDRTPPGQHGSDDNHPDHDHDNDEDEEDDGPHDFADVVHRLMGGSIAFGSVGRESGEFLGLIENLNQRNDTYIILESLNELSERLLMMNGLTAERMIPASKLAKSLVDIMTDPTIAEELELQLVACRCLYNFLEVNQDFVHEALRYGAIPALCAKLIEITYIDLTEQALQTLEMISRDPVSHNKIVASGGVQACLQYLDFLTTHAQRKSLTIVSNSCTSVSIKNFDFIQASFESLTNVIQNHSDTIVIEHCWLAISRIIVSFKLRPQALDDLFLNQGMLLEKMVQIILQSSDKQSTTTDEHSKVSIKYGTCLALIKSLIILVSVSLKVSRILLSECSIGQAIVRALTAGSRSRKMSSTSNKRPSMDPDIHVTGDHEHNVISLDALMSTPKDLLSEFLDLIGYLTPITFNLTEAAFAPDNSNDFEEKTQLNVERAILYSKVIPDDTLNFFDNIWPLIVNAFHAEVDYEIRKKVLIIVLRIVCFVPAEGLSKHVNSKLLASLLATVTNSVHRLIVDDVSGKLKPNSQSTGTHRSFSSELSTRNEKSLSSSYRLMLVVFLIARKLAKDVDSAYIKDLEREGMIAEARSTLSTLKNSLGSTPNAPVLSTPLPPSDYTNKFIDRELGKDFGTSNTEAILERVVFYGQEFEDVLLESRSFHPSEVGEESKHIAQVKNDIQNMKMKSSTSLKDWKILWEKIKSCCFGQDAQILLSSFELVSSGLLEHLLSILDTEDDAPDTRARLQAFLYVFHGVDMFARSLLTTLQDSLNRSESFELNIPTTISTFHNSSYVADNKFTSAMSRQIKLRISSADEGLNGGNLSNLNNMVISVHAIATFKSIANFLDLRFQLLTVESDRSHTIEDQAEEATKSRNNIRFYLNGEVIPTDMTIYGAIYRSLQNFPDQVIETNSIWSTQHNIQFRIMVGSDGEKQLSIPQIMQYGKLDEDGFRSGPASKILDLIRSLYQVNQIAQRDGFAFISNEEFVNWKLTAKINRQLEEPLVVASGTIPSWCVQSIKQYSFLFPLETRLFFLQSTSFGYSRLLHSWQEKIDRNSENNHTSSSGTRVQLGHPSRHKVRISRKLILQSAIKVLSMYGATPGILEIEYFDEVGSGLGPTLEFYASVSESFARKNLKMWRDDDNDIEDENQFVKNLQGLFPSPIKNSLDHTNTKKILTLFEVLGKFVARALIDSRIVDFNFNPLFWSLIQSIVDEKCLASDIDTIKLVDSGLANSLRHLERYLAETVIDGCTINDVSLTFSLPGYPDYDLIQNGSNILVTESNLRHYISRVCEATLYEGIIEQLKAFMLGFSSVFPIEALSIFEPSEIVTLLGSAEEDWSIPELRSATKANHGYNSDSLAIEQLLQIMSEFTIPEKRQFVQFLTGSPKLPIGGFKALRPEFTVVRKIPESGLSSDDYLPSVMTCANYLKLPEYSSMERMKSRLLQAVQEGAGEFHLS